MIVSFSHNDLDALVSQLCVEHKFKENIEYFNTNYRNINEKVDDIEDFCRMNIVKLIVITDVSFSDNKGALIRLADIGLPIIFIDHHMYPKDFFDDLPKNINVCYDINKCAATICYDVFKIDNSNLKTLCEITEAFDIWKIEDKLFTLGFYLNSYFWDNKMVSLMRDFKNDNYNLPNDFLQFTIKDKEKAEKYITNLRERNLIFNSNKITIIFADEFWMHFLMDHFKNKENKCLLIVNSWGSIKVRFNSISDIKKEDKIKIKMELVGANIGHENAFAYQTSRSMNNIMQEVRKIAELIENYGHL